MANQSTGYALISPNLLTDHGTTLEVPLGTRRMDRAGNEYIYLTGVASTVAGDWVHFDDDFETTRLAATLVGKVAVALSACVASEYGWYQIYGVGSAKVVATGGVAVFNHTVTGQGVATVVTGSLIFGAVTSDGNGNTVTGTLQGVSLNYPFVTRTSGAF